MAEFRSLCRGVQRRGDVYIYMKVKVHHATIHHAQGFAAELSSVDFLLMKERQKACISSFL